MHYQKILVIVALVLLNVDIWAQVKKDKVFTDIIRLETTSVKDQYKTSTCWSFCVTSLMESEIIRKSGEYTDLSEMWSVRFAYQQKAMKYVRMHGKINFTSGGAMNDVINVWKDFGIVPESTYSGLEIGEKKHVHAEMDNVLNEYVNAIIENDNDKLSPVWINGFNKLLDTYLGEIPTEIVVGEMHISPQEYLKSLDIRPEDYVMLTSFTHHPYYESFILEVPDNWSWGSAYNLKLDELIETLNNALENGYTVAWASDVSEKGFSFDKGYAVVYPQTDKNGKGTDKEKWEKYSKGKSEKIVDDQNSIDEQSLISKELRQTAFNNYETTDDHGMHIIGKAVDQKGQPFYIVKNSWGTDNRYNGYIYVSENYIRFKTISIMLHKEAIPTDISEKIF